MYSLLEALEDSAVLVEISTRAGVSTEAARRVVAGLASLPVRQAIRICAAAQAQQRRDKR